MHILKINDIYLQLKHLYLPPVALHYIVFHSAAVKCLKNNLYEQKMYEILPHILPTVHRGCKWVCRLILYYINYIIYY